MSQILISLYTWGINLILVIILFPFYMVTWAVSFLFDKRQYCVHKFSTFWACSFITVVPGWKVKIINKEKLNQKKKYIILSNHQSLLDILVIYFLNIHFKWVSKKELFSIPIVGWCMKLNQYVSIDRKAPNRLKSFIDDCSKALKRNNSLVIFPEGTRSQDGKLGAFKEGAFKLSIENKCDILPIIVKGTSEALPKKGFLIKGKQLFTITILDEIPAESFANKNAQQLRDEICHIMEIELKR